MNENNNINLEVSNMGMNTNSSIPVQVSLQPKKENKKIIIISTIILTILVVFIVVILGRKKVLTCRQEQSLGMGMTMNTVVDFNFDGKNVESADLKIDVDLGDYPSFKDTFIKQFKEEYSSQKENGLDVKITSDENKIYINFSAESHEFEAAGFYTSGSYKEVESDMERAGFSCK